MIYALLALPALLPLLVSLPWGKRIINAVGIIPYALWCMYGASALYMTLLTYVFSPFLSLYSVVAKRKNLPMPLYWLQTHDVDLDGGQLQGYKVTTNPFRLWWQRMCWLCRNPAYAWSATVIGIKADDYVQTKSNDSFIDYNSHNRLEFTIFTHKTKTGRKRFGIRVGHVWSNWFYLKYWIGWNHYAYGGVYHQVKTMANPFKKVDK